MFFLKAAYCRIFQGALRLALPVLPYREPEIIHRCRDLGTVLKAENARSVLIVTDQGIRDHGLVSPVEQVLQQNGISYYIYDRTQQNPTVHNVEEALARYHSNHCHGLIAVGGGSAMDCAKVVGARAVYPRRTVGQMGGILKVRRRLPVLIAIPTTAGTGSETTLAAVVTDPAAHHKYALMSFPLIPRYAVLDPAFTYSLPAHLTATTGMDALTHAVEAYIGRSATKETRRLALEAVRLIFENIEIAYRDGENSEAKANMLHAAYKAGAAFSKSYVGYIHAIAHSLSGRYGTPHGLANAVIMPYVLKAYGKRVHKKLATLGAAAGVCSERDSYEAGAEKFIEAVIGLNRRMGIPDHLTGIRKEDIHGMAAYAEKEANPLYPVPVLMTRKELERFYYQVADGRVHQ